MTRPAKKSRDTARAHSSRLRATPFSANGSAGCWGSDHVQVSVPEGLTQSAETGGLFAAVAARRQLLLFTAPDIASPPTTAALRFVEAGARLDSLKLSCLEHCAGAAGASPRGRER